MTDCCPRLMFSSYTNRPSVAIGSITMPASTMTAAVDHVGTFWKHLFLQARHQLLPRPAIRHGANPETNSANTPMVMRLLAIGVFYCSECRRVGLWAKRLRATSTSVKNLKNIRVRPPTKSQRVADLSSAVAGPRASKRSIVHLAWREGQARGSAWMLVRLSILAIASMALMRILRSRGTPMVLL